MRSHRSCITRIASLLSLALCLGFLGFNAALRAGEQPRLKRADSFLGVHFDFHAGPDCKEIGKNTTPEMIEDVIEKVRPDYLQIDCKGHRGLSSYPTKAGNPAPGFVGNPLRMWREVTARRGVGLFMHYSGVWDSEVILQHPDWAAIDADGKTNGNATSFFGPYAERLLVPQLNELAGEYGVDGAWVDGECWASVPDYGAAALKAFETTTGFAGVPRKRGEPHWFEFLEFNRDAFRTYLRNYIGAVKKAHPKFQLCSNWAFTDHMPEAVSAPVDFLSGDYSPQDSVNSARISARYLARQGKPWDLMAWSFTTQPGKGGETQKPAIQLQREAAVVLAMGGGFQAYITQKRDGSVRSERMPMMGEVAKFCRARQAICHHATQVPQIALLYSTAAHYRQINNLFGRDHSPFSGTLEALLASQRSVELLSEHHLSGRMQEYPLIIIPEWSYLDPTFKADLLKYVKSGGRLLVMGPAAASLFSKELEITPEGPVGKGPGYLATANGLLPVKGPVQNVRTADKVQVSGKLHASADPGSASFPAVTVITLGKGQIMATWFAFSRNYLESRDGALRDYLDGLVRELFPDPLVEVRGSRDVDVVVNRARGNLAINLINTSGPHRTEPILDSIMPVGPLELAIRQKQKPAKITLEPKGQSLTFEHSNGMLRVKVPGVEIHEIVVVER